MSNYTIYFDGGTGGSNPSTTCYGSFEILDSTGARVAKQERFRFTKLATNNEAEYLALMAGLAELGEHIHHTSPEQSAEQDSVAIYTDSQLVKNQLAGYWRIKKPHLQALHEATLDMLKCFNSWSIYWRERQANVQRFGH